MNFTEICRTSQNQIPQEVRLITINQVIFRAGEHRPTKYILVTADINEVMKKNNKNNQLTELNPWLVLYLQEHKVHFGIKDPHFALCHSVPLGSLRRA